MNVRTTVIRVAIGAVAVALVAGTALAVDPSGSASPSPEASAATAPSTAASEAASPSAESATPPSLAPSVAASSAPSVGPSPAMTGTPTAPAAKASEAPEPEDPDNSADGSPSPAKIADVVGRLTAAGIPATAAQVQELAGKVGLGGAVRVLAFAKASGKTPAEILAMFQSGKGWGQIDHELKFTDRAGDRLDHGPRAPPTLGERRGSSGPSSPSALPRGRRQRAEVVRVIPSHVGTEPLTGEWQFVACPDAERDNGQISRRC